jgi:hypothetical protein
VFVALMVGALPRGGRDRRVDAYPALWLSAEPEGPFQPIAERFVNVIPDVISRFFQKDVTSFSDIGQDPLSATVSPSAFFVL